MKEQSSKQQMGVITGQLKLVELSKNCPQYIFQIQIPVGLWGEILLIELS